MAQYRYIDEAFSICYILVGFFISYFLFVLIGYLIIPEGVLLDVAIYYKVDLTNEAWDDFMGILIFIGAAFVNALFIWGVVWFYQRAKAVVGHAPLTK
ncbi:hypothetical protein [Dryocola sp. LX212]